MKCNCRSGFSTSALAIAGVIALGVAGYNTLRTGCPLGSCADEVGMLHASTHTDSCCPLGDAKSDCESACEGAAKPACSEASKAGECRKPMTCPGAGEASDAPAKDVPPGAV